jgi:hypothetical protein
MTTDREKHGLKGPVRSVRVETAQLHEQNGEIAEKPWFSETITFNQDGWITKRINRNPDGSEWRTVNDYSYSRKLETTRTYDSSGALSSEVKYSYDDEGRLVEEKHISLDGTVTTPTTYAYDSRGAKIKIQEFEFSGEANVLIGIEGTSLSISANEAKRIETRYDDRGEAVDVKLFNNAALLISRVEITRDGRGKPLEETQYAGDVAPFNQCASGSCSTEEIAALTEQQKAELAAELARLFSPGTVMSKYTHSYDVEGRLIESKLTMMGIQGSRQTFAYDEAGNKCEEVSYNEDGTLASKAVFAREYDEHGNWTKELVSTASSWDAEFGLSTPAHVTRRLVTYL